MATADPAPAVGIDLGTTYSVVGVYRKRKVEIIQNDAGKRTTPSYVAFTDTEEYVGEAAKELANKNTLFDSKRLLGRRFDDPEVQKDLEGWPFTVVNDGGTPKYEIVKDGLPQMVTAEEVSAKVLEGMKVTAEDSLETTITKAVVTVPAYFNDSQKQATIAAGQLAGLDVIAILPEPTAAAMAFGFGKGKNSTVLIFDLGGGTFDVSVLIIRGDNFQILAHGGDTHLGGQDFDSILLDFVIEDIKQSLGVTIRSEEEPETLHELRGACELVKRKLSTIPQASINVFLNRHGKGYKKDITRALFEDLCTPYFKRAVDILPTVLTEAKVSKEDIDDVVLVGGSTRIPKVRNMVQEFFNGKELNKSVNPDEAVAQGAAIHAAALTGQSGAKQVVMQDVTSLSLGIALADGLVAVLIPRNTPLPFQITKGFTSASDNQEEAEFKVCQGERARWEDNHVLGDFTLSIPSLPQGDVDIATTFSLDAGGVLTVTARERSTNEEASVTLHSEARLSDRELQEMLRKAQQHRAQDEELRDRARRERYRV
ncbi:heat shock cognate 71 kDa protein-like [Thrips palmi]|uniref:Heat shock cognate 71 kDa protein-like n=1 Tax=Thrips palmi TaxID=161013 RepID=A0A6P8Y7A5_THRPL|nr:heat shock cognate 71 kDa protein-like [Thrips palmi]XP_034235508.1 heat shock cognate 71 kDa protein-like [Thrips palmi]XP_034235509.1 heat shock cognate 71 kDa protein-like [Thrips palmi]